MTALCTAADTLWHPGAAQSDIAFAGKGQALTNELRRWQPDDTLPVTGPEEVGAVLEGVFALTCGAEAYELCAGQGILIPPNEPHTWRLVSSTGVLYRVFGPPNQDIAA